MKALSKKHQRLIAQYPFIEQVLTCAALNHGLSLRLAVESIDNLTVTVKRADAMFLHKVAEIHGYGDNPSVFSSEPQRQGQAMRQREFAISVGGNGLFERTIEWPYDGAGRRRLARPLVAGDALVRHREALPESLVGPMQFGISTIVWVTEREWVRVGDVCVRRDVDITLHRDPKNRFADLFFATDFRQHLVVTRRILKEHAGLWSYTLQGMLHELALRFLEGVYEYQGATAGTDMRCWNAGEWQLGAVKALLTTSDGRKHVQLSSGNCFLHVDFERTKPGQSPVPDVIDARGTMPGIRHLVNTAIVQWQNPERRRNLAPAGRRAS